MRSRCLMLAGCRIIRPDKLVSAVQRYVHDTMVRPHPLLGPSLGPRLCFQPLACSPCPAQARKWAAGQPRTSSVWEATDLPTAAAAAGAQVHGAAAL
jgi:hypothetical protein